MRTGYLSLHKVSVCSLLCGAVFCFYASVVSYAQTDEEMQFLRMYYPEKELVVSATRNLKPISQVAENITVVTAEEIKAMNAHTVAEVLRHVPGVFISSNQDFGATSLIKMQGSYDRHVLVLVDGISWNFLNSGAAETNSIPVGIIERIEIIKGPASSAWGSSLGGVVNIITKSAGTKEEPAGTISMSYGERDTQDYRSEVAGKSGKIGYYLYAGYQESDGLRASRYTNPETGYQASNSRDFSSPTLYSKISVPFSAQTSLEMTVGYTEPDIDLGLYPSSNMETSGANRNFFTTTSLESALTADITLKLSLHYLKQKSAIMSDLLDTTIGYQLGFLPPAAEFPAGSLLIDSIYEEETVGGNAKLVWTGTKNTAVLGIDLDSGDLDQTTKVGPSLLYTSTLGGVDGFNPAQVFPEMEDSPYRTSWALYANDTLVLDRWTITPGIRYDHNDVSGSFISPSLGLTYQVAEHSVLRASIARGFTTPPLSWTDSGALLLDPNSDLDEEEVWSFQAGAESSALKYLWLKATVFRHEVDDTIVLQRAADRPYTGPIPPLADWFINGGKSRRQGFELEMETVSFHNLSLAGGIAYVDFSPSNEMETESIYEYGIGLRYNDRTSWYAELFGHYVWWDLPQAPGVTYYGAEYHDIIWDLNVIKKVYSGNDVSAEVFFTGHNLFNGSQYEMSESRNPRRWLEGGLRFSF